MMELCPIVFGPNKLLTYKRKKEDICYPLPELFWSYLIFLLLHGFSIIKRGKNIWPGQGWAAKLIWNWLAIELVSTSYDSFLNVWAFKVWGGNGSRVIIFHANFVLFTFLNPPHQYGENYEEQSILSSVSCTVKSFLGRLWGGSFGQACGDSYCRCKFFPHSFIGGQECSIFDRGNAYGGLQWQGSLEDGGRLAYGVGGIVLF